MEEFQGHELLRAREAIARQVNFACSPFAELALNFVAIVEHGLGFRWHGEKVCQKWGRCVEIFNKIWDLCHKAYKFHGLNRVFPGTLESHFGGDILSETFSWRGASDKNAGKFEALSEAARAEFFWHLGCKDRGI